MQKKLSLPTAYISHPVCMKHDMGAMHPESPDRLSAIQDRLISAGIWDLLWHVEADTVSEDLLTSVHTVSYVERLKKLSPRQGIAHLDPDTVMNPYTLDAALHAAGAVQKAVDLVMQETVRNAFCAVRPPGHHAGPDYAMGFCFFNNAAIAARYVTNYYNIQKVLIVDFDVHHGNGTEDIFADDDRILMTGVFQHPFFPYAGEVPKGMNMLNIPLARASTGDKLREAVTEAWLPAIHEFAPEFIVISAGFDAHIEDEMASMGFIEADYRWVTAEIMKIADQYADGRIVSVLEGGYDLSALGRSVTEHLRVLAELT